MNKNFKRKNKINNLLIRKLSFLIGKNRYRRRSKLNAVPYIVKNNPQRYGPGRNLCVINAVYKLNSSAGYRFDLNTQLLGNTEFSIRKLYFRYFKVLEVRAVFPQSGKNTDAIHYLNFSWNSIEESYEDIVKDDSTKMVSYYRPRTRIIKWRPIRSTINVNSIQQDVPINFINMNEFISTDRVVSLPGWLYVTNTAETDQMIIEIVVEFRGNDFGSVPKISKIKEMKELIRKYEEKIEKSKEENNRKLIINKLPDEYFSRGKNEENEEEIKEEYKENYENEEEILYKNQNKREINNKIIDGIQEMQESKGNLINKIREGILTNSRVKDINSSKPLINKNFNHYNLIKEDVNFQSTESQVFPLKFYENIDQERLTRKEGTFNKLKEVKPIFIETEIQEKSEDKTKLRKENMSKSKKHLLGENSLETVLPSKISEIT